MCSDSVLIVLLNVKPYSAEALLSGRVPDLLLTLRKTAAVQHAIGLVVMTVGGSERWQNSARLHQTEAACGAVRQTG